MDKSLFVEKNITSAVIIGDVEKRFDYERKEDWDLWRAYYNGWVSGRMHLIGELDLVK